jgi:hypothetical protein
VYLSIPSPPRMGLGRLCRLRFEWASLDLLCGREGAFRFFLRQDILS